MEAKHSGRSDTGDVSYGVDLVAVPAAVLYRARPRKRRMVQVAEPALVVGAPGVAEGEPWVDAIGRVRVRFPWHVEATGADRDSCWLRVVQPWAGSGWGTQFIPRVGMEVLVTFLGGDVDSPVVIGALPNGLAAPPFPLPESAATSGIRSRSTPGGEGYNELAFHDGKGAELVSLRAERDFHRVVQGDETSSVGGSRHDQVAGELVVTVSGGERRDVGGASRSEVRGDVSTEVHGSHTLDVTEQLTLAAGGKLGVSARGFTSVELGRGLSLEVGGDAMVRAVGPQSTLRVDAKAAAIVSAEKLVQLTSPEEIVFSVGDAKIRITPDTIELDAPKLVLRGRESLSAKGKGPSLELNEKAELVSKEVKILTEKAELTLNRDAELKGENIKLAKPADPPEKGVKDPEKKTKPFKIKVADAMHEPYADRHYVLLAGSEKLEGETGADGDIDVSIPESATTVDLMVWVGEYPTSEKRRFQVTVEELGAPDTPAGAQLRLRNLGFFAGEAEAELTQAGKDALRAFQFAHEIEPSGDLDATTVEKLKEVHGG